MHQRFALVPQVPILQTLRLTLACFANLLSYPKPCDDPCRGGPERAGRSERAGSWAIRCPAVADIPVWIRAAHPGRPALLEDTARQFPLAGHLEGFRTVRWVDPVADGTLDSPTSESPTGAG